jgi:hypothetical protein
MYEAPWQLRRLMVLLITSLESSNEQKSRYGDVAERYPPKACLERFIY